MARMRSAPALAAPSASAIHAHAARCRPLGSARSAGTSGAVRSAVTGSGHPAAAISPARTATVTTAKPARTHLPPSCLRLRGGGCRSRLRSRQLPLDLRRQAQRDAGNGCELLGARRCHSPETAEAAEQRPPSAGPDAGNVVERRGEPGTVPELLVVRVGEAVCRVPHPLEEEERG